MNLPITQSILHGALRPDNLPAIPIQGLTQKLRDLPNNLIDIEKLFITELGKYANFDFEKAVSINNIAPDDYTPINEYTIKPKIEIPPAELQQTQYPLFYNTITQAEATYIKIALRTYSNVVQSDIDTRQEIKETLKQIKTYIKKASDFSDIVYHNLQTNLFRLYYELTIEFDALLSDNDFTPFDDLYFDYFNHCPTNIEQNAYQAAKLIQQTQATIAANIDIQKAHNLLSDIYNSIKISPHNDLLLIVGCALQNYVFLMGTNLPIPSFNQLINPNFVNQTIKEQKSRFKQRYEREEIALDRANTIDDLITEFLLASPIQSPISITNALFIFLNQQKEVYLKDPSAVYKLVIEKQTTDIKTKPQPTIKPMQIKTKLAIANKHLAFLNGVNPKNNERIMSESDYKLLVTYVEQLIQTGKIPQITKKIAKANLPKTWFRYTLYLIHQELYSSIQDTWIKFMQQAFDEFSPNTVTFSTMKTKFSQPPSGYSQFENQVVDKLN